jgi:hypothetical protein
MSTDTRHGFEDGQFVTFTGVKGMTEVNEKEFKITVTSLYFLSELFHEVILYIQVHLHSPLVIQEVTVLM